MTKPKFGIYCGYDPRPWVMADCADHDIKILEGLIRTLSRNKAIEILYPGYKLKGWNKLCYTIELCETYAAQFAREPLAGLINVHQTWTFPQLSQKVITSYIAKMKAKNPGFAPRIILASIQDTTVPGMVSGMATAGALMQNGIPFTHVYGDFKDRATIARIQDTLSLFAARQAVEKKVADIVKDLHTLHALEFGSFSLRMPTTRINQEELTARWGITSENLDQQVFLDRAFAMFKWKGIPGRSQILNIKNDFVQKTVREIYDRNPRKFKAVKGRDVSRDKFALQTAMYLAVKEIAEERDAGAVTIKCQDECSSQYATCCLATSFMGNDTDMLGYKKKAIPTSCETDLPTMYSQALLQRISGKPAGFGDFRFVKTDKKGRTLLAIVNCGQHPLYYAGKETDSVRQKMNHVEYPGQEHFYAAGGSAVRMRTAGKQKITVARLGVGKGRLYMTATVMDTVDVPVSRHRQYNEAWPIIEGRLPITDSVIGSQWPSNHLGFVYGDHIPALIEMSEQMGIGYKIWDSRGNAYTKAG